VSNIGYEWFNQGFILEVRKMAVTSKLLQSMSWACCLYVNDFPHFVLEGFVLFCFVLLLFKTLLTAR
uniref:Uncharacterized protein n=1 Tax=Monodon monoceros TaxID=40151 RepID=A0A8C6AP93_MONMO